MVREGLSEKVFLKLSGRGECSRWRKEHGPRLSGRMMCLKNGEDARVALLGTGEAHEMRGAGRMLRTGQILRT